MNVHTYINTQTLVYKGFPHRLILASTWAFDKVSKVSGVWVEPRHTSQFMYWQIIGSKLTINTRCFQSRQRQSKNA